MHHTIFSSSFRALVTFLALWQGSLSCMNTSEPLMRKKFIMWFSKTSKQRPKHFFVFWKEVQASPPFFSRKTPWQSELTIKAIRWSRVSDRGWLAALILKTGKLLSSKNIPFLHCSVIQCAYFLANAKRCFFIQLVRRGFWQGRPKSSWSRCWTVRMLTFCNNSGWRFCSSKAVSLGFFAVPFSWLYQSKVMSFFPATA